jgi:hypothetical protein
MLAFPAHRAAGLSRRPFSACEREKMRGPKWQKMEEHSRRDRLGGAFGHTRDSAVGMADIRTIGCTIVL